jgi:hypothetical protein
MGEQEMFGRVSGALKGVECGRKGSGGGWNEAEYQGTKVPSKSGWSQAGCGRVGNEAGEEGEYRCEYGPSRGWDARNDRRKVIRWESLGCMTYDQLHVPFGRILLTFLAHSPRAINIKIHKAMCFCAIDHANDARQPPTDVSK